MDIGLNFPGTNSQADIIFDRAAETPNGKLIAGGYYLVQNTPGAKIFFKKLVNDLLWFYVPGIIIIFFIQSVVFR